MGIDLALKVAKPDSTGAPSAIQTAALSDQASFKTKLENAMLAEADLTSTAIMSIAMSIHEDSNYGAECLQRLKRLNARANVQGVSDKDLESNVANDAADAAAKEYDRAHFGIASGSSNIPGSPPIAVNAMDAKSEIAALEKWAMDHRPQVSAGRDRKYL